MRKIIDFTEERFIEMFAQDLKTQAVCFADFSFSLTYLEEKIKPMISTVDFMFTHHFISEDGYLRCKQLYEETIERGMEAIKKAQAKAIAERDKQLEQRKAEREEYIKNFFATHKIGDLVGIKGTLIGTSLPRYLEGGCLTIEGFTNRGNVKCRWDDKTVFSISPYLLKDVYK